MSFLSPAFLLAIPLIAVPVLIHFFARKQRELIRWGAMELLFASVTPRRRFLRLRDLLMLLLRIAIVFIVIATLARPMLSSNLIGSTGPRDVVIVLDNSMSTARKMGSSTAFERELDETSRVLDQLNATDLVRVLLAAPAPEWFNDTPQSGDSANMRALMNHLRELKPTDAAADLLDGVQQAVKADAASKDLIRFITVITDGQAHGWRTDASGAWDSLKAIAGKASPPIYMRVIMAGSESGRISNLAVEKITTARTVAGVGQAVILKASVKNTGTLPTAAASLAWSAGSESLGISTVPALQPGAGTTISVNQTFSTPGLVDIICRLPDNDDLASDNSAHFLLEVSKAIPILIVDGDPHSDPAQSESRYLLAALGYREAPTESTPSTSIFRPKLIGPSQLATEDLSAFRCVILANLPRVSADLAQKLSRFVNSGGGLWMALGDLTEIAAFNQTLYEQNAGLSPLALRQPVGSADNHDKFTALTPPGADNPATALLADTQRLDIDHVHIYRRHQFDAQNGSSLSVLLRAEGGAPVAVEKDLGRGRVIVQAIPLGLEWSNLPLTHSYVVMVHEWLWYLTESGLVKRNLQAGELMQVSQPIAASNGGASLETPTGQTAHLVGQEEQNRIVFRYGKTMIPGEYQLTIPGATQGSRSEKFLVNRDSEESDLTPLSQTQIDLLSNKGGLEFGAKPLTQPRAQRAAAPPKALAMWMLSALVLMMLIEALLAFWFSHRRRVAAPAVVMEPGVRA